MYTLENEDNGSGEVLMLVKYLLKKHEALNFCLGRMAQVMAWKTETEHGACLPGSL